jgi:hypothetical protein
MFECLRSLLFKTRKFRMHECVFMMPIGQSSYPSRICCSWLFCYPDCSNVRILTHALRIIRKCKITCYHFPYSNHSNIRDYSSFSSLSKHSHTRDCNILSESTSLYSFNSLFSWLPSLLLNAIARSNYSNIRDKITPHILVPLCQKAFRNLSISSL